LIKPFWRLEHLELPKIFWEEKYGQSWVLIHVDGISKVLAVGSTVWYLVRQVSGVISRLFNYGIDFNVWGYAANAESITFTLSIKSAVCKSSFFYSFVQHLSIPGCPS
jgi:hypothetical protein